MVQPKLLEWIRRMNDGGVLLVTDTDLTNKWAIPRANLHQEFEVLMEAGLTPNEILRMTGADAAEALGRDDIGIVTAGRNAGLVLLSAVPRDDIRNTREIVWVMQGGTIVTHGLPCHTDPPRFWQNKNRDANLPSYTVSPRIEGGNGRAFVPAMVKERHCRHLAGHLRARRSRSSSRGQDVRGQVQDDMGLSSSITRHAA